MATKNHVAGARTPKDAGPSYEVRAEGRAGSQARTMFSAVGPFWPCAMSKFTFWPSSSSRKPWAAMFE